MCGCLTYDQPSMTRQETKGTHNGGLDFTFHCMYNYQIFFFPVLVCFSLFAGASWRRQMGQRMKLRSAGQEEVGRRRLDDALALALLIFERWGNGQLLLCFLKRNIGHVEFYLSL